jgi:hypothetical protein
VIELDDSRPSVRAFSVNQIIHKMGRRRRT